MAITNYSELVTAIANKMARSDLEDYIPDFVLQSEQVFNHGSEMIDPLRVRDMEVIDDLSPTSNVYTLPDDYLQYRRVTELGGVRRVLDYMEPVAIDQHYPLRSSGASNHFTIIGNSLFTYPLSTNDVELVYYGAIPALTEADDENWLLTKAPSLYLRMSLMFANDFIGDDAETGKNAQMAKALIDGMNRSGMLANYARAGLTLRGVTP
jgi:hypothetical protein